MTNWPDRLYELLPAVHQIRDGERGEPLRQVLAVIGEQVQQVQDDVGQLYDNWFIETCDNWVVPYLGDLVGYAKAENAGQPASTTSSRGELLNRILYPRREIANLVHRRRRKGTLSVLEDLASDVAGWRARAVEFGQRINFFQNIQFPQPESGQTFSLRSRLDSRLLDSPFDDTAHTIDVRNIHPVAGVGWYHPNKVGLFVWRRTVRCVMKAPPCRLCSHPPGNAAHVYSFNRLGLRIPLYIHPEDETDETHLAEAKNLPMPLYRVLLRSDGHEYANCKFYGATNNRAAVFVKWNPNDELTSIPASRVYVCDLSNEDDWTNSAQRLKSRGDVAIDPECGLLLFRKAPKEVRVSYCYATTADMGGGYYQRSRPITKKTQTTIRLRQIDDKAPCKAVNLLESARDELQNSQQSFHVGKASSKPLEYRDNSDVTQLTIANKAPANGTLAAMTAASNAAATAAAAATVIAPHWQVNEDLCVEILSDDSYEIRADQLLLIAPGKTFEIRGASKVWPLLQIRSTDGQQCGNPWSVQLGSGSKLILDGVQVSGATLQIRDFQASLAHPSEQSTGGANQSSPCNCDAPAAVRSVGTIAETPSQVTSTVIVRHTTFVPGGRGGESSCRCRPNHASISMHITKGRLIVDHSIVGTLNVEHPQCTEDCASDVQATCPYFPVNLLVRDSIIDSANGRLAITSECCGPAHADISIERSTVLGDVCVQQMSRAEDSLFAGIIRVKRRSIGYMRFCYVPRNKSQVPALDGRWRCFGSARTPQRFKCLPDESWSPTAANVRNKHSCGCNPAESGATNSENGSEHLSADVPTFVTSHYGQPGYCELAISCPESVRRGAEDESELGVFHDDFWPQRSAALEARLQEFTPADMQSAVIYADDLWKPAADRKRPINCHHTEHGE